jgi:hypothetical protein
MHTPDRRHRGTWVLLLTGLLLSAGSGAVWAKRAKPPKDGAGAPADGAAAPRAPLPPGLKLNACGCYRRGEACVCTNRNAKCDCPEDCEPIGCDEKRQKEMDREVAAEMKRAQYEEKKRQDAEKEAQREAEARERKATEGESADDERPADSAKTGEPTADEVLDGTGGVGAKAPVKTKKAPRKEPAKK